MRHLLAALLLLSLLNLSQAQQPVQVTKDSDVALPLSSVGRQVGWDIGAEDYRVVVGQDAEVALEIFSPEINLADYANQRNRQTYYGDETYSKDFINTRFALRNPQSRALTERNFSTSQNHSWQPLFKGLLGAGEYGLEVTTNGKGKNAFALRVSGGVRIEASQFTVNAQGNPGRDRLVAYLNIGQEAVGKAVQIATYDADGPHELLLFAITPNGQRLSLTSSPDLGWASNTFLMDAKWVGRWRLEARIQGTAKQYSNAFALRLRKDNQPLYAEIPTAPAPPARLLEALQVEVVDTAGRSIVGARYTVSKSLPRMAEPVLPPGWAPVKAELLVGEGQVLEPTRVEVRSLSGRVRFVAERVLGKLEVSALARGCWGEAGLAGIPFAIGNVAGQTPSSLTLPVGSYILRSLFAPPLQLAIEPGNQSYTVRYAPQLKVELRRLADPDPARLLVELKVRSDFDRAVDFRLNLDGLSTRTLEGQVGQGKPFVSRLDLGKQSKSIEGQIRARLGECPAVLLPVAIKLPEAAKLNLSKSVLPKEVRPGQSVAYTLIVTNEGEGKATGVRLQDVLPAGLTGQNLDARFDIGPGSRRVFRVEARVTADAPRNVINTARLEWNRETMTAEAVVEVKPRVIREPIAILPPVIRQPEPPKPLQPIKPAEPIRPPDPAKEPEPVKPVEPVKEPEPIKPPEPIKEPEPVKPPEPKPAKPQEPEPVKPQQPEPVKPPEPEARPEPVKQPEPEPVKPTEPEKQPELVKPPEPEPEKPKPAKLQLSRSLVVPSPALPGEMVRVCLSVQNMGGSNGSYNLRDNPTALLSSTESVEFAGELEPGQTKDHCYLAQVAAGSPAQAELSAVLSSLTQADLGAQTPFERVNLALRKSVDNPNLFPGQLATYTISVRNPLDRPIKAELRGDSKLPLNESETGTIELRPRSTLQFKVTGKSEQAGTFDNTIAVYVGGVLAASPASAKVMVAELPDEQRESEVTIRVKVERVDRGTAIVVSDQIPNNAQLVKNSSRLRRTGGMQDNIDLGLEEEVYQDRIFWRLPVPTQNEFVITYKLSHTGPLEMPKELVAVMALNSSRSAGEPRSETFAREAELLQGDGRALEMFREMQLGLDSLRDHSGQSLLISAASPITNDPADQPRLVLRAFDQQGEAIQNGFITLDVDPEPLTPDAQPEVPGYQVQLVDGRGVVRLSNPGARTVVKAQARMGELAANAEFPVQATRRPWIALGAVGVQANLSGGFSIEGSARAFVRGMVGDWLLTAAANGKASYNSFGFKLGYDPLQPPADPFERFPLLGDSSKQFSDTNSSDAFYLKAEYGDDFLLLGQMNPEFEGLLGGYGRGFNGLRGLLREDGFSINAFAALVPNANLSEFFKGDGTSRYQVSGAASSVQNPTLSSLGVAVAPSSERITLLTVDPRNSSLKIAEKTLERLTDYTLDYRSGTIELAKPLSATDSSGNLHYLQVEYTLATEAVPQQWRYGLQVGVAGKEGFGITATALNFDQNQNLLFGLGARYNSEALRASLEATSSSALGLAGQLDWTAGPFGVRLRYQHLLSGYIDPNTSALATPGYAADLGITYKQLFADIDLNAGLKANHNYDSGGAELLGSLELRRDFGILTGALGAALKQTWGNSPQQGGYLTAGIEAPLGSVKLGLLQRIGLGIYGDTTFSLEYPLSELFVLRLEDVLTYEPSSIRQQAKLSVRGSFNNSELVRVGAGNVNLIPEPLGTTNIAASYNLDSADGTAGRARVGVDTTIPLSTELAAQLAAEAVLAPAGQGSGSVAAGLLYTGETVKGSTRAQFSLTALGLKAFYTAGLVAQLSPELVILPKGEWVGNPDGSIGGKFSLASAYRSDDWSVLTNNTYRLGVYAPLESSSFEGEVQLSYHAAEQLYVRSGVAYKLEAETFTGLIGAGATYFFDQVLGVGLSASYLFQPSTATGKFSLGLEGTLRPVNDLLFTVGLNLLGYQGIGNFMQTQPGLYLRLDWKFDERLFGGEVVR